MRTTVANAKASRIPAVMNLSPDDSRFLEYLNQAIEQLVKTGEKFWGLYGEFIFCVDDGCITLPRQIANVEAVAICGQPVPIRGSWFQFLQSGPGPGGDCHNVQCNQNSCGLSFNQKAGDFCAYRDLLGVNKRLKVYCDVPEASGEKITLMGYNADGNWIRTQVSGEWIDGEQVALNSVTPQVTVNFFSALTAVQKPITNGNVRLYEYDTDLTTQRDIAVYEPDETNPAYRRVKINGLPRQGCCGQSSDDEECAETKVTVMAKLEFIPVRRDTDFLLIGNLPALKAEIQSIMKMENNIPSEAAFYHATALGILRNELRHYVGSGVIQPIKMSPRNVGGAAVQNMI